MSMCTNFINFFPQKACQESPQKATRHTLIKVWHLTYFYLLFRPLMPSQFIETFLVSYDYQYFRLVLVNVFSV